jgi:ABC-type taurine transport system ATPase subunit
LPRPLFDRIVVEKLDLVDLSGFGFAYSIRLSGDVAHRVGTACRLATNRKFCLLDERLAALDAIARVRIQGELEGIRRSSRLR